MLDLKDKIFFITGVANKKSVATFAAKSLIEYGATCAFGVQNEEQITQVAKLFPDSHFFICDVEKKDDLKNLSHILKEKNLIFDGFLHSMAFGQFDPEKPLFHQTSSDHFLQATQISAFSLVELTHTLLPFLKTEASIVTVSISDTLATSYGYLGPIKAMLETCVSYLAKSLSLETRIRVNAVGAGPLKTSASAGIPNYVEHYTFAEALTMRKEALHTKEVANVITFLLSSMSSGINATTIRVDAGMRCNGFDEEVVKAYNQEQLKK